MALQNNPMLWHILAVISIVGGLLRVFALMGGFPDYYTAVTTKNIVMSQYVLWAILFEIIALNVKD